MIFLVEVMTLIYECIKLEVRKLYSVKLGGHSSVVTESILSHVNFKVSVALYGHMGRPPV